MDITLHFNSLNIANQLEQVHGLLLPQNASASITFWGSRVVKVKGFTGSIYLDDLAKKIKEAAETRRKNDDLSTAERVQGVEISDRIYQLYDEAKAAIQLIKATNSITSIITRFFMWIRRCNIDSPFSIRYTFYHAHRNFGSFKEEEFFKLFGNERYPNGDLVVGHYHFEASTEGNVRIYADEEQIRAMLD